MPLANQEALGTISIRIRERLGGGQVGFWGSPS